VDQQIVKSVPAGTDCEVVLDRTPFYAESGGQAGDTGAFISAETGEPLGFVSSTYAALPGLTVHKVKTMGELRTDVLIVARVNEVGRRATMRNHTATHLAHAALRQVLGAHVKQAGSVVEPSRLRFDFTHYTAVDQQEIAEVERMANAQILLNTAVSTEAMDLDKAIETGAMALFGEKYGEKVRVVSVPGFSRELCGGTHVASTGEIGMFKIVYEGSISAGVRRIEGVTGAAALRRFQETAASVSAAANLLKTKETDLLDQLEKLVAQQRTMEKELTHLREKAAHAQARDVESQAREIRGAKVLSARVDGMDRAQMRNMVDALRNKWGSGVVVLASASDGNVAIVAAVTKDLTAKVHAGKVAGAVAQAVGGKGGGRPDLAEAGGKDASGLNAALDAVYASVEGML
jgi:alanyl-tRNA synthetase